MFCRYCGKEIHETAISCPGCGAVQGVAHVGSVLDSAGSLWMAITSLICGILGMTALLDDSKWDMDMVVGVILFFSCPAAVFGIWTLVEKRGGRNMSIAGIVMAALVFVICVGIGAGL